MNPRKSVILLLILTATGLTSGCRSGCSLFGRSLSLLAVPMYKQPLGYSSTFHEHLTLSPAVIDYTDDVAPGEQCRTTVPTVVESPAAQQSSDKVIFPKPSGPVCELPSGGETTATDTVERR